MQPFGQPFHGIHQVKQVARISPGRIAPHHPLQKAGSQCSAAELDHLHHPLILLQILGPDKGRLEQLRRMRTEFPDAAEFLVGGMGFVGDQPRVGKGDLGVVGQLEGAAVQAALVGQEGQLDSGETAVALAGDLRKFGKVAVQGAVQVEFGRGLECRAGHGVAVCLNPGKGVQHAVDPGDCLKLGRHFRACVGKCLQKIEIDNGDAVEGACRKQGVQRLDDCVQSRFVGIEAGMVEAAVEESVFFRTRQSGETGGQIGKLRDGAGAMAAVRDVVQEKAEVDGIQRGLELGKKFHIIRVWQEWDIEQEHRGSPAGAVFWQS